MILKRLFQSPWRKDVSANSSSATAPVSQAALAELSKDPDPSVRRLACGKITDLDLLCNMAANDPDNEVRVLSAARMHGLLAGVVADSPDLAQRLTYCKQYLDGTDSIALAAHLLRCGTELELRLLALPKVIDSAILAESAVRDNVASLRLAAVERLTDKEPLEQVARLIGKKDKGVYRIARQKLKAIAEREQAPLRLREEAAILCTKIEKIAKRGLWSQDKPLTELYTQQWTALNGQVDDDLVARFNTALGLFQQGYATYQAECQARLEVETARAHLQAARHELLAELGACSSDTNIATDFNNIETKLAAIGSRWVALDQEASAPSQLQSRYDSLVQDLQECAQRLREIQASRHNLTQQLELAQGWLAQTTPLDMSQIREWRETGKTLAARCNAEALAVDYRGVAEQLQQRLEHQQEQARQRLQHLTTRLDTLEQELETGVLRQASTLYQSLNADLVLIRGSGIGHKLYATTEQRLHKLTPRLRELQSWRKWGTNQHRLEMCEVLERLATEDLAPALLAEQVQNLQQEWKRLDRDGIRVNEALWKRFHQAANLVYERCKPYLEEQEHLRELNRQARESLCQQIETFLEQVDWTQLDWKKAVRAVREVRTTWESLGAVDPRQHKALNQRYRAATRRLNRPLAQERARNRAFRQGLITQAQALVTAPDIAQAIQEVRHLQDQWHITVAATRSQEDSLWREFRAACDQVFERRREAQQLQQDALESQLESLGAICETLENLAKAPGSQNLSEQFEELKARWEAGLELGLPRQEETRIQRRWQQGVSAMRRRVRLLEEAGQRAQMERLRTQAAFCTELEALINHGPIATTAQATTATEWQHRWGSLPRNKDPVWHAALERRFNAAVAAVRDAGVREQFQAIRQANTKERSLLCLQLEILAGVPSPPEALQERLAFQVSRLAGRLSQGVADSLDEFPQLERTWYACGPAYGELVETLEQRFERTRRVLSARGPRDRDIETRTGQHN